MTKQEIIDGLQFTIDMFLFSPITGENKTKEQLNKHDKLTVDACEGAIKLLNQYVEVKHIKEDDDNYPTEIKKLIPFNDKFDIFTVNGLYVIPVIQICDIIRDLLIETVKKIDELQKDEEME